jgi:hypothetical protein
LGHHMANIDKKGNKYLGNALHVTNIQVSMGM